MAKQDWKIVLICVTLSALTAIGVNIVLNRKSESMSNDILRVKGIELVDTQGRVLGAFELTHNGRSNEVPQLVLRDSDGRDSMKIDVDARGDGALSFSNDHWKEGAIILGHLQNVDDGSESKSKRVEDKTGAWGLRIRSSDNRLTGIGFLNSGEPITPIASNK